MADNTEDKVETKTLRGDLLPPERLGYTVNALYKPANPMGIKPDGPLTKNGRPPAPVASGLIEPIWERQHNESARWYQCFLIFADLPPAERTQAAAWRKWQEINGKDPKKPVSHAWVSIMRQWQWEDRALARDQARAEAIRQSWPNLDMERRRAEYEAGAKLLELAMERLQDINSENLPLKSVLQMMNLSVKMQQAALNGIRPQASEIKQIMKSLPEDMRRQLLGIVAARLGPEK